jgi:DNA (cytosine-5)-methyltransferase 1
LEHVQQKTLFNRLVDYSTGVNEQLSLLRSTVKRNQHLPDVLKAKAWNYDDLRYVDDRRPVFDRRHDVGDLAELSINTSSIPIVSFFSGAGGLDLGFEAAGFSHVLISEKNPLFCSTVRLNRPQWDIVTEDISNTEIMRDVIRKRIGKKRLFDGIFVGGPPCQPFSIAANQRFSKSGENFKRVGFSHETNGNLLFDYVALIKHFLPRAFLIENVPGLLELDGGTQLSKVYDDLQRSGYTVFAPLIARAEFFGVPQYRTRLFVIGYRGKKILRPPAPSKYPVPCGAVFTRTLKNAKNHVTREHSAESILRYMMLPFGGRDQLGRVDRLDPCRPSKTVIAGGTAGGGRSHLHPYIPRTLSVRECARLQTFPEDYEFVGPVARQFTQVGNAVPPVMAARLAVAIRESYFDI